MKKELLAATASAAILVYGAPALADCLPNAGGTTITCQGSPNAGGYNGSATNGLTVNVEENAEVTGTLLTGTGSAVNNEGDIDVGAGNTAISVGGNSIVSNASTATGAITGNILFGAAGTGQTNTLNNANSAGGGIVGNTSSAGGAFVVTNSGDITGNVSSVGNMTLTNTATGTITGNVSGGAGNDSITNAAGGEITGDVDLGGGANDYANAGIHTGDLLGSGDNNIDNSGTLDGDIVLGDGDDNITNTGTITGDIAMGSGTNVIGFSEGTQLPGGGNLTADPDGNSTVVLYGTTDETLALNVTGFDRLLMNGTGTWTLDGYNGYDEAIYVDGGTINVEDADYLGDNAVVNDSQVTFTGAGGGEYSGNMSRGGSVLVDTGSTTTFSGTNTYTGGTTIDGGTLILENGAALSDVGAVVINTPGVLQVDTAETIGSLAGTGNATLNATLTTGGNNTSTTYSGVASGAGGLTKAGTGNMTLTGVNTFTGALTVSGGTLTLNQAGGNAIADTVAATVGTGATLALSTNETLGSLAGAGTTSLGANTLTTGGNNGSTAYSGVISGTGALVKTGTGTMTLTGANTYTGGTTLSAGGITGTTSGIVGNYTSAAGTLLTFDQATAGTYAGDAALLGALAKTGAGAVTLTGDVSAAEGTTVSGGRLNVNGTLTSDVEVGAGAVLGGNGDGLTSGLITGNVNVEGGTTAPGNSIGSLVIDGDLTHDAASTLQIEVAMVGGVLTSDHLTVTGTVNADGALAFVPATGFYRDGQTVEFVDAGALAGSFATVTGLAPNQFIDFTVDIDDSGATTLGSITVDRTAYSTVAATTNQEAIADALDAAVAAGVTAGSAMEGALTALDYTANAAAAQAAFDQMSGEIYGSFVSLGQWAGDSFQNQINRRVRDNRAYGPVEGTGMQVWFRLYNYWNSMDTKNNLEGFDGDTFGGALGFDSQLSDNFIVGLALGYSKSDLDSDLLGRDGDVKSYQIGAYATGNFMESGFVDASVFYAKNNGDMDRSIAFGTFSSTASADVDSDEFRGRLAVGANVGTEELRFRPYAALEYSNLSVDGFTETGAGALALTVSNIQGDRFIGEVGMELDGSFGGSFVPSAYAAYRHAFDRDDRVFTAAFAGSAASTHTLIGQEGKKGVFAFGVALGGEVADGVYFSIDYDGAFNGTQNSHAIGGGIRARF